MEQNLFQELDDKRRTIKRCAERAREMGWIDEAQEREMTDKIDNEVLTLGVIGQMKCGKSTFLCTPDWRISSVPIPPTWR